MSISTSPASNFSLRAIDAARENPAAAALIGAGLFYMLFGAGPLRLGAAAAKGGARLAGDAASSVTTGTGRTLSAGYSALAAGASAGSSAVANAAQGLVNSGAGIAQSASGLARDLSGAAAQNFSGVAQNVSGVAQNLSGVAQDARTNAQQTSAGAMDRTSTFLTEQTDRFGRTGRETVSSLQSTVSDVWERQPLALGIVGALIGAGFAAAVPTSDAEQEWFAGPMAALKARAGSLVSEQVDKASALVGTLSEEASKQGLTLEAGKQIVDELKGRVGEVAKAARTPT